MTEPTICTVASSSRSGTGHLHVKLSCGHERSLGIGKARFVTVARQMRCHTCDTYPGDGASGPFVG